MEIMTEFYYKQHTQSYTYKEAHPYMIDGLTPYDNLNITSETKVIY